MGIVLNMHLSIYLVDLSRHTTVNHELYIAKLAAYGFSGSSLRLIQNYLSKRRLGKNRFFVERMARNNSWCAPRIKIKAYFVQHFHK